MSDKLREAFERDVCKPRRLRTMKVIATGEYVDLSTSAALEAFQAGYAHAMRESAADQQAEPVATQYIALCDAMGYNERTDSLTSPEEHAQSLVTEIKRLSDAHRDELLAEIKRLKEQARPMTDEEMILRGWRQCAVGQRTTQYCGQVGKAVAAEREACAKVLDDWKKHNWTFEDCAAVVRARGEK